MKIKWIIQAYFALGLFLVLQTNLNALSVRDVKVSATADSSAVAREQAIEKAHALAFEKLVEENFPDKITSLPSTDTLMNMVTNFSIDKEKTTPKSYSASLTFQFDPSQVQAWIQKSPSSVPETLPTEYSSMNKTDYHPQQNLSSTGSPQVSRSGPIKLAAQYASLSEWQHIKKVLEGAQGMIKVNVLALSSQQASLDLQYAGDIEKLKQFLLTQGLTLAPDGNGWIIHSNHVPG